MKNFFELFLLPQKFAIDLEDLEKKYLDFQNQFHPDKSSLEDVEKSILINEAYKILADDFLRACYLLSLKGIDIRNDEKALKVDQSTLERVLELQERISEITDGNEIKELQEKLNIEVRFLIAAFVKCLDNNDLEIAGQILVKTKYVKKSLEDLKIRKRKL